VLLLRQRGMENSESSVQTALEFTDPPNRFRFPIHTLSKTGKVDIAKPYARKQNGNEQSRSKRLQFELRYEEYCRHEVERYLEEELGGNEYKILFAAKKQELALTYRNLIFNPASLTEMSHAGVRSEIMQRVKLQTFEKFCAGIGVRLFGEDI
jgi:hypothetical protein